MAEKARITALVLTFVLFGLVTPHNRASGAFYIPNGSDGGRVVSAQKTDSDRQNPSPADKNPTAAGPMEVFSDIERGWKGKEVDMILRHFGKSKVTISVDGTGPLGGQFSKNQSYYLLKDLFKYTITRKFEFVQYRKPDKKGKKSFAVAERLYQKTDDGRLFKDKIFVSLHLESAAEDDSAGKRWVVDEIKSIR